MALTLADLYASPDHYLQSFDGDAAIFVPMDRAAYHRSIFLDRRIVPAVGGTMRLPLAMLASTGAAPASRPISWIFHVAHCGSTLLARALDDPATNLVLREPLTLRQLALMPSKAMLPVVLAMIGKRYRADAPTIVKANVPVNFLLPDLAAEDPQARAILLYMKLDDYLIAILRSDNHRVWLRNVTTQLDAQLGNMTGWGDAERAAGLWLAQVRAYAAVVERRPGARSLDAETFFADPRPVLAAAAAHLRVDLSPAQLDATVAGPLFHTYSKNPAMQFDNAARIARRRETETALAAELAAARAWIDRHGGTDPLTMLAAAALR